MKKRLLLFGLLALALPGCDVRVTVDDAVVLLYPYKFQIRNSYRSNLGPFVWWGVSWDDKVSSTVNVPVHLKRGELSPVDSSMYPNVCICDSSFRPIYVAHRLNADSVTVLNL